MFTLNGKRLFIYGYNNDFNRINDIVCHCEKAGCKFEAIIDQKNYIGSNFEIISFNLFVDKYLDSSIDEIVIFLNLRDSSKHTSLAKYLYDKRINKVIFVPSCNYRYIRKVRQMKMAYNKILYGGIEKNSSIPIYDELLIEDNIIDDYGDYVSFWIDVDRLYSDVRSNYGIGLEYDVNKYYNCPIRKLGYYMELYDYFFNNGKYPTTYMENSLNGRDEREFLNNRKKVFEQHAYMIKYDPFDVENTPILISWDSEDHNYKIKDGYHRAISYIKNGYDKVPVICKKEDYKIAED